MLSLIAKCIMYTRMHKLWRRYGMCEYSSWMRMTAVESATAWCCKWISTNVHAAHIIPYKFNKYKTCIHLLSQYYLFIGAHRRVNNSMSQYRRIFYRFSKWTLKGNYLRRLWWKALCVWKIKKKTFESFKKFKFCIQSHIKNFIFYSKNSEILT